MYLKLFPLLILSAITFPSFSQKKINSDSLRFMDSLFREAAKTEVYKPIPPIVTSGKTPQDAPSDAIILFNGRNLDAWYGDDSTKAPGWDVVNGILTVNKKKGGLMTKQKFIDYQLHLEYRIPVDITGEGQMRGNSGIWLART